MKKLKKCLTDKQNNDIIQSQKKRNVKDTTYKIEKRGNHYDSKY